MPPHMLRNGLRACLVMPLIGCADVTQPLYDRDTMYGTMARAAFQSLLSDSTCIPTCTIVEVDGEAGCMCAIEGIAVNVPGGPGDPGPYPPWPEPPGFPESDPGIWPVPPGGGTWPNLPEPGPGECDPDGITNSCFFSAELTCPTDVARGTVGTCVLSVDPPSALETVYVWTFNGNPIHASSGVNSTTWRGKLVQSGQVRVEFRALGRDEIIASAIKVNPRLGWEWSAGDGITLEQGGMTWPSSYASIGAVCRPGALCPGGAIVDPSASFGHGNGYSRAQVPDGPNTGAWFVASVATDLHMAALINPDYLAGGSAYPATSADAIACGGSGSDTIMVGFTAYNEQCQNQSMLPFESWAWDHETEHMMNAVGYVAQTPRWDPRVQLEDLVYPTAAELDADATSRLKDLPDCVHRAAATHDQLGTFPGIPTTTWFWQPQPAEFQEYPPGAEWWHGLASDPNPFASPCG